MITLYLKRLCCCFLLHFIFLQTGVAQTDFIGKVIDERDDSPIANASVYFNNTTISTKTNADGEFKFEHIHFLNTELVIYFNGYELIIFKPTTTQMAAKKFVFKLHPKELLSSKKLKLTPEFRKNYLDVFYDNFLGITEEATKCAVTNEPAINFVQDSASKDFNAFADIPIVIINNLLGYKISYNLADFYYDGSIGQAYFTGYCRYEELGDKNSYKKERSHCYLGSSQHFYHSLVTHQLYGQGFSTFVMEPYKLPPNATKEQMAELTGDALVPRPIAEREILFIDSTNNLSIGINGQLVVQYNKNPYSKKYLAQFLNYVEGDLDKGIEANIYIKHAPVELSNAGMPVDDTQVQHTGFWTYERVANTLPYDYLPE